MKSNDLKEIRKSNNGSQNNMLMKSDERDLDLIFTCRLLVKNYKLVLVFMFVFCSMSVIYSVLTSDIYKASLVLAVSSQDEAGSLQSIANQYSGLASIAGVNMGSSGADRVKQVMALAQSWYYTDHFINKFGLKPLIVAVNCWDTQSNKVIFNNEMYDHEKDEWKLDDQGLALEPTSLFTFEKFRKMMSISQDSESGLITLSFLHESPSTAVKIVNLFVQDLNDYFRERDKREANSSINYLQNKLESIENIEMRQVFYNLIEGHNKTLVMTEVNEQYLLKTIIPAMHPQKKVSPRRVLIILVSTIFGAILATIFVIMRHVFRIN